MKHESEATFNRLCPQSHEEAELTEYERRLGLAIIESLRQNGVETSVLSGLHEQLDAASVRSREFTGHGFFVDLAVSRAAAAVSIENPIGHVTIGIPGQSNGGGAIAFCKDGYFEMIEVWTWGDEGWPFEAAREVVFGRVRPGLIQPEPAK